MQHSAVPPVAEIPEQYKEHLLILEDDSNVADLLKLILEEQGYSAHIAYNAEQAKQLLKDDQYDILTLDLLLPGQSGIDFFRELRSMKQFQNIPVIVISSVSDKWMKDFYEDPLSVVDWLEKPVDKVRLGQAISLALEKKRRTARILHIEDDQDIKHIICSLLQNVAEVDVACDLAIAKEKLHQDYDLVILDLPLPDGSGETLLPVLQLRDIPVVIFSAKEIDSADMPHACAHFVKSKTSNLMLINKINSILKNKRR
ncbi:MAG: response regulator [Methylobacter sp.]|nr:response regulator [Methylobacter sp.]